MERKASRSAVHRLLLESGPDAGRTITIPAGALVLGRAAGPGRIDDPALEAHHLVLRCDGPALRATQLAGRIPVRIDGAVLAATAALQVGSILDLGSTRAVVCDSGSIGSVRAGSVVLGVGVDGADAAAANGDRSFAEQAEVERRRTASAVTVDLDVVRRMLVTGPPATGLVRAILAQTDGYGVSVTRRSSALRTPPRPGRIVVVHDVRPDIGWPGDELPPDAVLVDVGATWRAVLTRRTADGGSTIVRFRAAGRPAPGDHGRTGRSSLSR